MSIGTKSASACSLIITTVNWSALDVLHQFRLDHYPLTDELGRGSLLG
jgi:hypothetical protein